MSASQNIVNNDFMNNDQFFVTDGDYIKLVIDDYNIEKKNINLVYENIKNIEVLINSTLPYFINDKMKYNVASVSDLFDVDHAIKKLNAKYWNKLIVDSKLIDVFPYSKRKEWNDSIYNLNTPNFEESIVRETYAKLISERWMFFADKIDDIFRNLSKTHLTNSPEGFRKRMIIDYCFDSKWGISKNMCFNQHAQGVIHDLRSVLSKFNGGKDELAYHSTRNLLNYIINNVRSGEWFLADSGAFKIRWYLKGTMHIEINPDFAWKLNKVLSLKYPQAIPANYRTKPVRKIRDFEMIDNPVPQVVLNTMSNYECFNNTIRINLNNSTQQKDVVEKITNIMKIIGGELVKNTYNNYGYVIYQFGYSPKNVFEKILFSGTLPDQKTHQFYPTPMEISKYVMDLADVGKNDKILEPSAGRGDLLRYLPDFVNKNNVFCIEISSIFCNILRSKGFVNTLDTDFINWAEKILKTGRRYDRIIMNPPFSDGRCIAHIQTASKLLNSEGKLVAVLPSTYENKLDMFKVEPNLKVSFGNKFSNKFDDTSIEVIVLIIERI